MLINPSISTTYVYRFPWKFFSEYGPVESPQDDCNVGYISGWESASGLAGKFRVVTFFSAR